MKLSELSFKLPESLIAQHPARPADQARMMILNRKNQMISEDVFFNLDKYLNKGDVLVFNNSKVLPARLIGKKETGGNVETLLLKQLSNNQWEALIKNGGSLIGKSINFSKKLNGIISKNIDGLFFITFNLAGPTLLNKILKVGKIPTPPYIKSQVKNSEYQNVFAKTLGSAAAPTAGLHFTKRLLSKLKRKGVQIEFVTLHVGLGTFQPVRTNVVEDHQIHSEYYEVTQKTQKRLQTAKKEGRKIIAVGTTSCRVLEAIGNSIRNPQSVIRNLSTETNIFIFPGYKFQVVDSLITNFHTPYSSLLALVMALAGKPLIKQAYALAIKRKYKFFSLGDGMFID